MSTSGEPISVSFLDLSHLGLRGQIGMTAAPGRIGPSAAGLKADLDRLRDHYRTDLLVSLLEEEAYEDMGISDLPVRAEERGMENVRFPIQDLGAPRLEAMNPFLDLVARLLEGVRAGQTAVIHCYAGNGRSGMVAACCLVALGHGPDEAIRRTRMVRPRAVETRSQEHWVQKVSEALGNRPNGDPSRNR